MNTPDIDELLAIPRLAEHVGVTPRVIRYWEQLGLISPTGERGKLRYSPRDTAMASLIKRLLEVGMGVDGIRLLKETSEREIRQAARTGDEATLVELALRILYQRKAFREETQVDEERYLSGHPERPATPPEHRTKPGDRRGHEPPDKRHRKKRP